MDLLERFTKITERYDEDLFLIFKEVIDEAIKEANNKKMNGVLKYNSINHKIEETYVKLAQALGVVGRIDNENLFSSAVEKYASNPPVSERLEQRIYDYIKPQEKEALEYFKLVAINVRESKNVRNLLQNYQELESLMKLIDVSIYRGIELNTPPKQELNNLTLEM